MPTNYITNDTDLTIVANAIRTKGGTQAQLTYPNGFATAIQNLPSYTTYDNSYVSLYTITPTLTNVTASASNESYIEANGTVTLTYTANSGYNLPSSVSVTGATGVWTQASGTLVLSNPTGNVTFSIVGESTAVTVTVTNSDSYGYNYDVDVYQNDVMQHWSATHLITVGPHETKSFSLTANYFFFEGGHDDGPFRESMSGGVQIVERYGATDYYTATANGAITVYAACLTGDTLVTMADNSTKRLDEIELGDEILSYNWETMQLVPNKVIFTDKEENKSFVEYDKWTFDDGTIIKTVHRHEFYNVEAQCFKYMDEWNIGEHTYKIDGTTPMLIAHETIKEEVNHYKITGELGTNYFANGLLTGDRNCPKNINLG